MKNIYLIFGIILWFVASCANDPEPLKSTETLDSIVEPIAASTGDISPEKQDASNPQVSTASDSKQEMSKEKETKAKSADSPKADKKSQTTEEVNQDVTAEDIDSQLNNKVNTRVNPDNANATTEVQKMKLVNLIPVYSEKDKAKYYVQFCEKARKATQKELVAKLAENERVYVVEHLGLYKYCLGQFDSQEQAQQFKLKIDKQYGLKDTEVVSYSNSW
jgi:hypothetical protein